MTKEIALLWVSADMEELVHKAMMKDVVYRKKIDSIDKQMYALVHERRKISDEKEKEVRDYIQKNIEEANEVLKEP